MSGIFGAYNLEKKNVLEDIYLGLYALQHRGQMSAGVAWICNNNVFTKKEMGLVHNALDQQVLAQTDAHYGIGHVCHYTPEHNTNIDSQPIGANYLKGPIAIVQSGNFTNTMGIAGYLENQGAVFHTNTSAEVILQLMAHHTDMSQLNSLKKALSEIRGGYSVAIILNDALIVARDPWGVRPLVLGKKDNTYYVSSETCALDLLGATHLRDIAPGEILVIDRVGTHSHKINIKPKRSRFCAFEYVYLARPDSVMNGQSVYSVRKKLGEILSKKGTIPPTPLVVGLPDSGTISALGMTHKLKCPFDIGVVRNRYVGRTFIQPTERVSQAGTKIKLNPQAQLFRNKNVIAVDDSLIKGETAQRVVSMIRNYQATSVHIKIASPPIMHPCYYGINFPSSDKLLAVRMNKEEIAKEIGADSIEYLTCEELADAIGIPKSKLCTACFDGTYLKKE